MGGDTDRHGGVPYGHMSHGSTGTQLNGDMEVPQLERPLRQNLSHLGRRLEEPVKARKAADYTAERVVGVDTVRGIRELLSSVDIPPLSRAA